MDIKDSSVLLEEFDRQACLLSRQQVAKDMLIWGHTKRTDVQRRTVEKLEIADWYLARRRLPERSAKRCCYQAAAVLRVSPRSVVQCVKEERGRRGSARRPDGLLDVFSFEFLPSDLPPD